MLCCKVYYYYYFYYDFYSYTTTVTTTTTTSRLFSGQVVRAQIGCLLMTVLIDTMMVGSMLLIVGSPGA